MKLLDKIKKSFSKEVVENNQLETPGINIRLYSFRPNQLFEGHAGSVWITDKYTELMNKYYGVSCHQKLFFNGVLSIHMIKYKNAPKYIKELFDKVSSDLNLGHHICFVVKNDCYQITFNTSFINSEYKRETIYENVFTHGKAIKESKLLGKHTTKILNKIKNMDYNNLINNIKENNLNFSEDYLSLNLNIDYED